MYPTAPMARRPTLARCAGALFLGACALMEAPGTPQSAATALPASPHEETIESILELLDEYRRGTREVVRPEGMRRVTDLDGWRSVGDVLAWRLLELEDAEPGPEVWHGLSEELIDAALERRASHQQDLAGELLLFASLGPAARPRIEKLAARSLTVDTRIACAATLALLDGDDFEDRAADWRTRVERARNGPEILWDTEAARIARTDVQIVAYACERRDFAALEGAPERCALALSAGGALSAMVWREDRPRDFVDPTTRWSLRTVRRLAAAEPRALASALVELDDDGLVPGPPLGARDSLDEMRTELGRRIKRRFAAWLGPGFAEQFAEAAAAAGWPG